MRPSESAYERKFGRVDRVLDLGSLCMEFARVERIPMYPDGRRESDVEHSYMLAVIAPDLAAEYYPELNNLLVGHYALVHDIPEVLVGDTPTLGISDADRMKKEFAEAAAVEELLLTLPPFWANSLRRYEDQNEPEARFVRLVDKLMPLIVNIGGDGKSSLATYGITSANQLKVAETASNARLRKLYPEFEAILDLHEELIERRSAEVFAE